MSLHPTDVDRIELSGFDWFFAGGTDMEGPDGSYRRGQMYVERYVPRVRRQPVPVVMWHGGVQTGSNFTATPDGRRGWLHDFLRAGYTVLVVNQPERGRSGHAPGAFEQFGMLRYSRGRIEERFTAGATRGNWPRAAAHSQWPGAGVSGDPVFERFFASQVQMLADRTEIETLNRDAGVALLDAIGPAILLTHSQSGPFGWLVADARPGRVKAIVALEPNGPPFREVEFLGKDLAGTGEPWYRYEDGISRPWGITRIPLCYDPAPATTHGLAPEPGASASPDRVTGYLQGGVPRRLTNLARVPTLIATAEASYHATYDHCTSAYLEQASVRHDFVRLPEWGLHGNGHMVMLEKNNHAAADRFIDWLANHSGEL